MVEALGRCSLLILQTLNRNFPNSRETDSHMTGPSEVEQGYAAAIETFRRAGARLRPDFDLYLRERSRWEPLVRRVAPTLGYGAEEIDRRSP